MLLKIPTFLLCLLPLCRLIWAAVSGDFGANPVEFIERFTGFWALNFLMITLLITPIRQLSGWNPIMAIRRMLGLFCFFYAILHLFAFIGFDHDFDAISVLDDVGKRPFVTVGMAAFLLLIPLAITSIPRLIRWMGGQRWQLLHRSIYLIGILAVLHYFWLSKATALLWPSLYAVLLALLLGFRLWRRFLTRKLSS